jgi:arginine:ornithine antiporter/lysine permease
MGVLSQAELAGLPNPSMAYVLRAIVGEWGATVIIIGSIISVLGALLAWVLLCAEVLYAAAGDGTVPAFLGRENTRGVPANALWLSNGLIQVFLLLVLVNSGSYTGLVLLAASMSLVPYFLSTAFGVQLAWRGQAYAGEPGARWRDFVVALLASAYALWLVYAGGLDNLLLSVLLYVPGVVLFAFTRHQRGEKVFTRWEWALFGAILVVAIATLVAFSRGELTL